MTASNFAMRMLITHSDFPYLYRQTTSNISYERDYALQKLSELYDGLLELVTSFDDEQEFDEIASSINNLQELVTFLMTASPYGAKTLEHVMAIADCHIVRPGNPCKVEKHLAWHNQD